MWFLECFLYGLHCGLGTVLLVMVPVVVLALAPGLFLGVVLFLVVVLFLGVVLRPAERGDDDWPGASSPNTAERRPSSHSSIPSSSLSLQHVERIIFLLIVISEFREKGARLCLAIRG